MKKSIPIIRERESEAFILGNGREREFPLTPGLRSLTNHLHPWMARNVLSGQRNVDIKIECMHNFYSLLCLRLGQCVSSFWKLPLDSCSFSSSLQIRHIRQHFPDELWHLQVVQPIGSSDKIFYDICLFFCSWFCSLSFDWEHTSHLHQMGLCSPIMFAPKSCLQFR